MGAGFFCRDCPRMGRPWAARAVLIRVGLLAVRPCDHALRYRRSPAPSSRVSPVGSRRAGCDSKGRNPNRAQVALALLFTLAGLWFFVNWRARFWMRGRRPRRRGLLALSPLCASMRVRRRCLRLTCSRPVSRAGSRGTSGRAVPGVRIGAWPCYAWPAASVRAAPCSLCRSCSRACGAAA